jgi:hypothetical protein
MKSFSFSLRAVWMCESEKSLQDKLSVFVPSNYTEKGLNNGRMGWFCGSFFSFSVVRKFSGGMSPDFCFAVGDACIAPKSCHAAVEFQL